MKRVLWISDLVIETGFSRVAHSLISRLKNKYEIVGLGINYFGDPHKFDFDIYPAFVGGDVYGFNRVAKLVDYVKPDMVFILNDSWIINNYLAILKKAEFNKPVVVYFPVDGENHNPAWYQNFDIVTIPVTYTEFGKSVVDRYIDNVRIIPHGIDRNDFFKIDKDKNELRHEVLKTDKFDDKFIVFNGNRNQPRKRIDLTLQAFKIFAEGKDDVALYMHCGVTDASINVIQAAEYYGISSKLILSNSSSGVQQVSRESLNKIYNLTDVGVNTSWGEGWGLVNFEHASVGVPQVVPNHTSFPEVLGDTAIYVEPYISFMVDNQGTIAKLVHPASVAQALSMLYEDKKLYKDLSDAALARFSDPKYSWDTIAKQFDQIFEEALQ